MKIMNLDKCLYLTKRTITFDNSMNEITTVTLDSELRTRDIDATEIELREAAAEPQDSTVPRTFPDLGVKTLRDTIYSTYEKNGYIAAGKPQVPNTGVGPSD